MKSGRAWWRARLAVGLRLVEGDRDPGDDGLQVAVVGGGGHRGLDVLVRVDVGPVQGPGGFGGHCGQERPLGASVALPERVHGVEVTEQGPGLGGELGVVEMAEVVVSAQAVEDGVGEGADVLDGSEGRGALGDVDGADLAGPLVDVTEEVAVDGLEVGEVVTAEARPVSEELELLDGGDAGFGEGERFRVGDAEPVPEGPGEGIGVGVDGQGVSWRRRGCRSRSTRGPGRGARRG